MSTVNHPPPPPPAPAAAAADDLATSLHAALAHASNVSASTLNLNMSTLRHAYSHAHGTLVQQTAAALGAAGVDMDAESVLVVSLLVGVMGMLWVWKSLGATSKKRGRKNDALAQRLEAIKAGSPAAAGGKEITPLEGFDVDKEEPVKIRPFKRKYNLTMALENLDPNELILMDKTYRARMHLRKRTLHDNPSIVIGVNRTKGQGPAHSAEDPRLRPAIVELHDWLMAHYLPTRYPTMFRLVRTHFESATEEALMLHNRVTGEVLPALMSGTDTIEAALKRLNRTVDEDMLILLPQADVPAEQAKSDVVAEDRKDGANGNARYVLEAYFSCMPSGFNPAEKLGHLLADIHGPVPGYEARLERSMDRFFARVEAGRFVRRANWTVTHRAGLFALGGTHAHAGEEEEEGGMQGLSVGDIEAHLDETFIRSERQTLYRLPGSKALVFGFHTYVYPLEEVKREGWGEEVAAAIDGFALGNAPGIAPYKRVPQWGEAVKEYMRK